MRFQVSQVMDAIEQRLTTDITGAQAVVDVGAVIRRVDFDHGRAVNLVRVGMVVDALGRYLVDEGAMLYGVVERSLLSEQEFTSKERMVLSRWADDGLIEVTAGAAADRAVEVADLTGLPLIITDGRPELAERYRWFADGTGRALQIAPRAGVVVLSPSTAAEVMAEPTPGERVIARAPVRPPDATPVAGVETGTAGEGDLATDPAVEVTAQGEVAGDEPAAEVAVEGDEAAADAVAGKDAAHPPDAGEPRTGARSPSATESSPVDAVESSPVESPPVESSPAGAADVSDSVDDPDTAQEPDTAQDSDTAQDPVGADDVDGGTAARPAAEAPASAGDPVGPAGAAGQEPPGALVPVQIFADRGTRTTRTRISWHRLLRVEPEPAHAALLRREWRCQAFECAAFGEGRRIGQPAPQVRGDVPVCPRHGEPMVEVGPRPAAYPVSIVVEDLPRQRVVVRAGRPVPFGRDERDPDLVSVARWLHGAAKAWISPLHLQLEADPEGLTVTDLSENGTVLWQRKGPDDPGVARPLFGESHLLGEWDSVELYTGIELMRGDRRIAGVLAHQQLASVLSDAPTAAYHQVST